MSADCDVNVAMRGLEYGACYYLMKPISIHDIKNIWQHLIRKKKIDNKEIGQIGSVGKVEVENTSKKALEDGECASTVHEGNSEKHYKRENQAKEDEDGSDDSEEHRVQRQPRIRFDLSLHKHFTSLVNLIGIDSKLKTLSSIYLLVSKNLSFAIGYIILTFLIFLSSL